MEEVVVSLNQHSIMEPKVIRRKKKIITSLNVVYHILKQLNTIGDRFYGILFAKRQQRDNQPAILQEEQVAYQLAIHQQSSSKSSLSTGTRWLSSHTHDF